MLDRAVRPGRLAARGLLVALAAWPIANANAGPEEHGVHDATAADAPAVRRLRAHVHGAAWLASLTGSLQTPAGGAAGSTSPDRPTTQEIGLDGLRAFPTVDVEVIAVERHGVRFGLSWIAASGSATLDEPLVSQGVPFPAGAEVESDLQLPIVRIGYRPRWLSLELARFVFTPEVGFGFALFDYRLESDDAVRPAERSYGVGFPIVGLLVERPLGEDWTVELDVGGFGGVNGVTWCDADVRVRWTLPGRWGVRPSLVAGLRGTYFRREDDQPIEQNDVVLHVGSFSTSPWAGLHLGARLDF